MACLSQKKEKEEKKGETMVDFAEKVISCCRCGANLINGYEAALIGVSDSMLPIYDYWKIVNITKERVGISSSDDAVRYVDKNIIRRLPADKTNGPIIAYGSSAQENEEKEGQRG